MKKKILALCLVVVLAITAVTGATLAYFTDTDSQVNTFTYGNIDIDLIEDFPKNELLPGKANAVKKEASIKNTGSNEAWVWAEVLIPAALDDQTLNNPDAPGKDNSLHFNFPGEFSKEWGNGLWYMATSNAGLTYGYAGQEDVGGVRYNKFVFLHETKIAPGEETKLFMSQAYMDAKVTQCVDSKHEKGCLVLADGKTHYTGTWDIIVRAYGMQDAGFADVFAAYAAYDGKGK